MAITITASNHAKYQILDGKIDLSADTLKVILMNSTFSFDKDADATLSDVTSDQLSSGNGYTQNDKTLSSVTLTEDDTNDRSQMTCDDVTWTASGGSIGATGGFCIYDDTTSDDTIIAFCDFDTDYTISDGSSIQIQDIIINLS